jgi:hypothetical protein
MEKPYLISALVLSTLVSTLSVNPAKSESTKYSAITETLSIANNSDLGGNEFQISDNEIHLSENVPDSLDTRGILFNSSFDGTPEPSKLAMSSLNSPESVVTNDDLSSDHNYNTVREAQISQTLAQVVTPPVSTPVNPIVPDPKNKPAGWSSLNFSSPVSPAAKIIGASPDGKITTISTPNDFSTQLLNGVNSDGDFATGISIDTLPYVLIRGTGFSLAEYRDKNSWLTRFLANTKLSIATTKATDSVGTARLGVGVEFVLINDGDLRRNETLFTELEKIVSTAPPPGSDLVAYNNEIQSRIEDAKTKARREAEQQAMWNLAFSSGWVSPTGRYSDLRGEGIGVWSTYRRGLGTDSQLVFHASYRSNERINDGNNNFVNADTLLGGVRLLSGSDKFRFSLETAYNRESQAGNRINDYISFGLGLEPKISDNLWLSVSFLGTTGRQNGSDFQIGTGIKWNFNTGYLTGP